MNILPILIYFYILNPPQKLMPHKFWLFELGGGLHFQFTNERNNNNNNDNERNNNNNDNNNDNDNDK
jgi:hypothetical protein